MPQRYTCSLDDWVIERINAPSAPLYSWNVPQTDYKDPFFFSSKYFSYWSFSKTLLGLYGSVYSPDEKASLEVGVCVSAFNCSKLGLGGMPPVGAGFPAGGAGVLAVGCLKSGATGGFWGTTLQARRAARRQASTRCFFVGWPAD